MQTMHLFAGIGGGLLADLILGHTPIVAVEWDGYACQVLRERAAEGWFPGLHVWEGDVRLFDPSKYAGKVDCIHAGFPCQDLSHAGNRAGLGEGTRSGLYREVLRIAGSIRPEYLFLENVPGILSGGLEHVLADLASMGFHARWCCLRASDVGANHQRDRWWLMAYSSKERRSRKSSNEINRCSSLQPDDKTKISRSFNEVLPNTMQKGLERHGHIKIRNGEEYASFGDSCWWEIEPNVGRVDNGISNRVHRLKGLGNAQVPLQAAVAWKLLGGP